MLMHTLGICEIFNMAQSQDVTANADVLTVKLELGRLLDVALDAVIAH